MNSFASARVRASACEYLQAVQRPFSTLLPHLGQIVTWARTLEALDKVSSMVYGYAKIDKRLLLIDSCNESRDID